MNTIDYLKIAEAIKAEAGIKEHIIRKSLTGCAWVKERKIEAPEGKTRNQLCILAHECAHVVLVHIRKKTRHLEEAEAEKWAYATLRRYGVVVPRKMVTRGKNYVAWKIEQAIRRGAKRIAPEAKVYARNHLRIWR